MFNGYEVKAKTWSLFFLSFLISSQAHCEIDQYTLTENTGLNKKERIDKIEEYLIKISTAVREVDSKNKENAKSIKQIEDSIKQLKEVLNSKTNDFSLGPKKSDDHLDKNELASIKRDILELKNKDIEQISADLETLKQNMKSLEMDHKKR